MCGHCVKEAALLKISQTAGSFLSSTTLIPFACQEFRWTNASFNKPLTDMQSAISEQGSISGNTSSTKETIGLTKSSERRSNSHKKTRGQLLMPQGQIDSHKNQIWLRKKTSLADLLILHLYGLLYHDLCPQTFSNTKVFWCSLRNS